LIQGSRKLRQCGYPVNSEFERVVIERIEREILCQGMSLPKLSYSLQAIMMAGKEIAQEAPFCSSYIVQRLKFSNSGRLQCSSAKLQKIASSIAPCRCGFELFMGLQSK